MANLTLKIDDELLKQARIRAIESGTSVNELVRRYLAEYASSEDRRKIDARALFELSGKSRASSGRGGRTWTREELYQRPKKYFDKTD